MLVSFLLFIILLLVLYGYSAFFKTLLTNSKLKTGIIEVINMDIIFGLFFLLTILIVFHFFLPLKYLIFPIYFLGLLFFIYYNIKKVFNFINFNLILFVTFVIFFINSSNGPTYDTQLYHHQLLNWNYSYKITMNLVLVDDRMGMISPWYLFLSLGNLKFFNSLFALVFNFVPVFILISETINSFKQKLDLSKLYIVLSSLFIIFFSLIHPFKNGIIMMHLGSLGTDFPAMIFFILIIYYFLKNFENKKNKYLRYVVILSTLTLFCRISYLPILILPLYLIFSKKFLLREIHFNILIALSFFFWFSRSLVNNGCLIFPVKFTCFGFNSYIPIDKIGQYSTVVKSFARTAPEHKKFMDLDFSINSNDWFIPWIKNYFFTSSLTQIFFVVTSIFLIPFILKIFKSKNNYFKIFILILMYILTFFLWLEAPDIRFALGLLISMPIVLISFLASEKYYKYFDKLKYFFIFILFVLILKNYENYSNIFEKNIYVRNYNYKNFKVVKEVNGIKVVRNSDSNGFCYNTKHICKINEYYNFTIEKNKFGNLKFKEIN